MTPSLTASGTWKAPTTAPAGRRSILRRPPDICSTRSTYSRAKSIQMSDAGHEVCIFTTVGLCPTTAGAVTATATVAPAASAPPFRRLRRDTLPCVRSFISSPLFSGTALSPLAASARRRRLLASIVHSVAGAQSRMQPLVPPAALSVRGLRAARSGGGCSAAFAHRGDRLLRGEREQGDVAG